MATKNTSGRDDSKKTEPQSQDKAIDHDLSDMSLSGAVENPEELLDISRDFLNRASSYLEREVRNNPYAVLGAAASFGYILGQGWLRAVSKVGMAFIAQEAARRAMPGMGSSATGSRNQRKTVH